LTGLDELGVGFGQQPPGSLVGLGFGEGFIKRRKIEVACLGGNTEREDAIVGDFVECPIRADVGRFQGKGARQAQRQRDCGGEVKETGAGIETPFPHVAEKPVGHEQPAHGHDQANRYDDANMVGFPNVDEDFLGVPQIIDGYGIKAGFEFVEKEKLNEQ
jgi:hypothetical protein